MGRAPVDEVTPPRYGISDVTYGVCTFDDATTLAVDVACSGIGVWETTLGDLDTTVAARRLRECGLRATNVIPQINTIFPTVLSPTPAEPDVRSAELRRSIRRLAPLRPDAIVVLTGALPAGLDADAALDVAVRHLRPLALLADDLGTRLAVEPIHRSCAVDWSIVTDARGARDLARAVEGLGVVVDTWHLADDPTLDAMLRHDLDLIAGVQVADWRVPDSRSWADRAFPGEGTGGMPVVERLIAAGFDGIFDVEIFSDDGRFGHALTDSLWNLPAAEIARRATRVFAEWSPGGTPRS